MKSLSRVQLLVTPWTAAYQAPPSVGFSRQEYWSGVPLPSLLSPPRLMFIAWFLSEKSLKSDQWTREPDGIQLESLLVDIVQVTCDAVCHCG